MRKALLVLVIQESGSRVRRQPSAPQAPGDEMGHLKARLCPASRHDAPALRQSMPCQSTASPSMRNLRGSAQKKFSCVPFVHFVLQLGDPGRGDGSGGLGWEAYVGVEREERGSRVCCLSAQL